MSDALDEAVTGLHRAVNERAARDGLPEVSEVELRAWLLQDPRLLRRMRHSSELRRRFIAMRAAIWASKL